jgi:BMFP domain-containing protein YqiC
MKKPSFLSHLAKELAGAFPDNAKKIKKDVEKNVERLLQNTFNKLNLVSREEFDALSKVLIRSRKKLEDCEKRIKELEKMIK